MFIDKVKIFIKAGNGGDGGLSFLHAAGLPNGGPDGGNGGDGGDIVFVISNELNNLAAFHYNKHFRASNGENGNKRNRNGKNGEDLIVYVPKGTIIRDAETNKVIADMFYENKHYIILHGGKGGKGNAYYATATRQAPRFSQSGEKTEERAVILELKTFADIGLVGYPNVGKSTLLSRISEAKPKIANYHFTTLSPNLGVVKYYDHSFVVADIPGLIKGASEGVGLGHDFLRHIERTRMLVHVIDISSVDGRDPYTDFCTINDELKNFSDKLASLPQIIALNKCDLLYGDDIIKIKKFIDKVGKDYKVVTISALSKQNIQSLVKEMYDMLSTLPPVEPIETELANYDVKDTKTLKIRRENEVFVLEGGYIDNLVRGIVVSNYESRAYFEKRLRDDGVIDRLKAKGLKNGDTVRIKDIEFEYTE